MKRYEKLKNKAININSNINASRRRLKNSRDRLEELNDRVDNLREEYKIHSDAIDVLKEIIEGMSVNHIEKIENMITYGLQTIFFDRDYAAEIQVEDKRNSKHAEFYLLEKRDGKVVRTNKDAIGGGVKVILGFILQVFYIQYFNLNRVIFCDESFSQLSESYIDGLMEFIGQLADKRGYKIILISHDNRLTPEAKRLYKVNKGEIKLVRGGEDDN